MAKFHLNPTTGVVNRCDAHKQPCRFGGESGTENHFESIAEARVAYEASMAENKVAPPLSKKSTTPKKGASAKSAPGRKKPLTAAQKAAIKRKEEAEEAAFQPKVISGKEEEHKKLVEEIASLREEWSNLNEELKAAVKKDSTYHHTDEWFSKVQERKNILYRRKALELDREALQEEATPVKERKPWGGDFDPSTYNYHPEVSTTKDLNEVISTITALTGLSKEEVQAKAALKRDEGKDETTIYREIFRETPIRSDKPIVSIDLEVAALDGAMVDTGPGSSIIEVGYLKRWPDGRVERKSYLSGVPQDLLKVSGTGAQHVHNISPEMVEGKTPFVEDEESSRELLDDLRGSVLVAHNARFETNQFTHNLKGFAKAVDDGEVEVLDTKNVVKWHMPKASNNSNQSFVEATGGSYTGAHRAYEDASMTLNSLLRLKGEEEVSP